jgi:hypothetical protein
VADRVLLIGKRAAVLTRLQAALREIGIEADLTQDTAGADRHQLRAYRAVAFGRAVGEADRARMRDAFRAANADVRFVDGLAPITPLLVAQFEQALDRRPEEERRLHSITVSEGRIEFELRAEADVRVTGYRLTRLYRTRTEVLLDERLQPGTHTVELGRLARVKEAFAVVRADDEVQVVPLRPNEGLLCGVPAGAAGINASSAPPRS